MKNKTLLKHPSFWRSIIQSFKIEELVVIITQISGLI